MLSYFKVFINSLLGLFVLIGIANAQYYYGNSGPIPLQIDSTKVLLKFDPDVPILDVGEIISDIPRISSIIENPFAIDSFIVCSLLTSSDYMAFLDSLTTVNGILFSEPYYTLSDGSPLLVGRTLCIGFNGTVSSSEVDSIAAEFGIAVDTAILSNVYIMKNAPASGFKILELANEMYELNQAVFSHPDFGLRPNLTSYKLFDYYNSKQSHLKKMIGYFNDSTVWDFAGVDSSLIVAVLDDGLIQHEDLPLARILQGHDYVRNDKNPYPSDSDGHGMATAGIIAASHTTDSIAGQSQNSGIVSLNPMVKVLPVRLFQNGLGLPVSKMAEGITFAWKNGADVISNSWQYGDTLDRPILTVAIDSAYEFGRNGLGCPVIFSSGNLGETQQGIVSYPARLSSCLAIGALDLSDYIWYYSQYGPKLDLVATSDDKCMIGYLWSLDQMGTNGYNSLLNTLCGYSINWNCTLPPAPNDSNYNCSFGGTSAAAPVVAGVAALILSKDSNLTADEVYDILRYSAVTELESGTITPPDTAYGYGRVDAFRAILSISRGDLNNDGAIGNILDFNILVNWIFRFEPPPNFPSALLGDCNCDGATNNILDLNWLSNYIFREGPPPVSPCFEF